MLVFSSVTSHDLAGFFAFARNDGSLAVLDMRGPTFIYQDTNSDTNRRASFLKHSTVNPFVSLSWAIFKLCSGQSDYSPMFLELTFYQSRVPVSTSWGFAHQGMHISILSRRMHIHTNFMFPRSRSRSTQFPNASLTVHTFLILPRGYSVLRADRGILIHFKVIRVDRMFTG